MSVFDNQAKDLLLAEIRYTYKESDLSFAEFMVVLFEILAYFAEDCTDQE